MIDFGAWLRKTNPRLKDVILCIVVDSLSFFSCHLNPWWVVSVNDGREWMGEARWTRGATYQVTPLDNVAIIVVIALNPASVSCLHLISSPWSCQVEGEISSRMMNLTTRYWRVMIDTPVASDKIGGSCRKSLIMRHYVPAVLTVFTVSLPVALCLTYV